MATAADDLVEEVRAFGTLPIATQLRLALIRRALLEANPAADVTPSGLATYGACYQCLGLTQAQTWELAMLDQLNQALV